MDELRAAGQDAEKPSENGLRISLMSLAYLPPLHSFHAAFCASLSVHRPALAPGLFSKVQPELLPCSW